MPRSPGSFESDELSALFAAIGAQLLTKTSSNEGVLYASPKNIAYMMTMHRPKKKTVLLGEPQPRKTSALGPVSLRISKEGPEVDPRGMEKILSFSFLGVRFIIGPNLSTGARHQSCFEEATSSSTIEGDQG